jgi:hypothetical protein
MSVRTWGTPVWPAGTYALAPAAAQAPAANVNAVCTLTGVAGQAWKLEHLRWSYNAAPTAGSLTVAWTDPAAGAVSEVLWITVSGPGALEYNRTFPAGSTVTITLAAGGAGVSGTVYVDAENPVA